MAVFVMLMMVVTAGSLLVVFMMVTTAALLVVFVMVTAAATLMVFVMVVVMVSVISTGMNFSSMFHTAGNGGEFVQKCIGILCGNA